MGVTVGVERERVVRMQQKNAAINKRLLRVQWKMKNTTFYVTRTANGAIESVSRQALPGAEPIDEGHPDIQSFFSIQTSQHGFDAADTDFVRAIEDLIDILMAKNIIRHTDLPDAVQQKLMFRKGLRRRLNDSLNLLDGEDEVL